MIKFCKSHISIGAYLFIFTLALAPHGALAVYNQSLVAVGDQAQQISEGSLDLSFETEDGQPVQVASQTTREEEDGSLAVYFELVLPTGGSEALNMKVQKTGDQGPGTTLTLPAAPSGQQIVVDPATGVSQLRTPPLKQISNGQTGFSLSAGYFYGLEDVPQVNSNALIKPLNDTEFAVNQTPDDIPTNGFQLGFDYTFSDMGRFKKPGFELDFWYQEGDDSTNTTIDPNTQSVALLFPRKYQNFTGINFSNSGLGINALSNTNVENQGLRFGFNWQCGICPWFTTNLYAQYDNYDTSHSLRSYLLPREVNIFSHHNVRIEQDRFRLGLEPRVRFPFLNDRLGLTIRGGAFLDYTSADVDSDFHLNFNQGQNFNDVRINQSDTYSGWSPGLSAGIGLDWKITDKFFLALDAGIGYQKQVTATFPSTGDEALAGQGLGTDSDWVTPRQFRFTVGFRF